MSAAFTDAERATIARVLWPTQAVADAAEISREWYRRLEGGARHLDDPDVSDEERARGHVVRWPIDRSGMRPTDRRAPVAGVLVDYNRRLLFGARLMSGPVAGDGVCVWGGMAGSGVPATGPPANDAEREYVTMNNIHRGLDTLLSATERSDIVAGYRVNRYDPELIRALRMNVCRRVALKETLSDWERTFLTVIGDRPAAVAPTPFRGGRGPPAAARGRWRDCLRRSRCRPNRPPWRGGPSCCSP